MTYGTMSMSYQKFMVDANFSGALHTYLDGITGNNDMLADRGDIMPVVSASGGFYSAVLAMRLPRVTSMLRDMTHIDMQ